MAESLSHNCKSPPSCCEPMSSTMSSEIKECLDGLVHVTKSMEKRSYIIPQYPTLAVELLHIVVSDKGNNFDCFLEIKSDQKLPEIPGDIYVEKGFFLQVIIQLQQLYADIGINYVIHI